MDVSNPRAESPSMEPSSKLFCCRYVRRCLPLAYREELYHILRMTGPLVSDSYFTQVYALLQLVFLEKICTLALFCSFYCRLPKYREFILCNIYIHIPKPCKNKYCCIILILQVTIS